MFADLFRIDSDELIEVPGGNRLASHTDHLGELGAPALCLLVPGKNLSRDFSSPNERRYRNFALTGWVDWVKRVWRSGAREKFLAVFGNDTNAVEIRQQVAGTYAVSGDLQKAEFAWLASQQAANPGSSIRAEEGLIALWDQSEFRYDAARALRQLERSEEASRRDGAVGGSHPGRHKRLSALAQDAYLRLAAPDWSISKVAISPKDRATNQAGLGGFAEVAGGRLSEGLASFGRGRGARIRMPIYGCEFFHPPTGQAICWCAGKSRRRKLQLSTVPAEW